MSKKFFIFNESNSLISVRIQCMKWVEEGKITISDATKIVHSFSELKKNNINNDEYIKVILETN